MMIDQVVSDDPSKTHLLWGSMDDNSLGWKSSDFNNLNNHSVVIRVDFGKSSLLIQSDTKRRSLILLNIIEIPTSLLPCL